MIQKIAAIIIIFILAVFVLFYAFVENAGAQEIKAGIQSSEDVMLSQDPHSKIAIYLNP